MSSKNKLKNIRQFIENESISLRKYLMLYYGIRINPYNIKISHQDIKFLFPNIERVGIENVDNIYCSDVICVYDSYNLAAIYKRPNLNNNTDIRTVECSNKDYDKLENAISLENLNTYELSKLCKTYRDKNRLREYKIAYTILKNKKIKNKKKEYKREKNLIKRGIEYYD